MQHQSVGRDTKTNTVTQAVWRDFMLASLQRHDVCAFFYAAPITNDSLDLYVSSQR